MSLTLVLTGLVVFVTHGLEAITGFGCTVLALPFVTLLLGIDDAKFLLAILAWALALYIAISKRRRIVWRQYGIILLFVGLGLPIGMYAFATFPKALLIKFLGIFIIISAFLQLWKLFVSPLFAAGAPALPAGGRGLAGVSAAGDASSGIAAEKGDRPGPGSLFWYHYVLLFIGGIVHGAFASGGPLVVLYASRALPEKGNFRATLTLIWATLNTVLILGFASAGMFSPERWSLLGWMAAFLVLGIVVGEIVHNRVHGHLFIKIVFATLFLTGIFMTVL